MRAKSSMSKCKGGSDGEVWVGIQGVCRSEEGRTLACESTIILDQLNTCTRKGRVSVLL